MCTTCKITVCVLATHSLSTVSIPPYIPTSLSLSPHRYGGRVEFNIKYGGAGQHLSTQKLACRELFEGEEVRLSYSIDGGRQWKVVWKGDVLVYRRKFFTRVALDLPRAAWTHNTRFKWHQDEFMNHRAYWALDDVVVRTQALPSGWLEGSWVSNGTGRVPWREAGLANYRQWVQEAQCCLGTAGCSLRYHLTPTQCRERLLTLMDFDQGDPLTPAWARPLQRPAAVPLPLPMPTNGTTNVTTNGTVEVAPLAMVWAKWDSYQYWRWVGIPDFYYSFHERGGVTNTHRMDEGYDASYNDKVRRHIVKWVLRHGMEEGTTHLIK